jgi:hypothetical protein
MIYGQCADDQAESPFVCDVCEDNFAVSLCGITAEQRANARRIVAAVNACEGIPTEALELGIVADLLAALEAILPFAENEETSLHECWRRDRDGGYDDSLTACTAALSLARSALARATRC